MHWLRNDSTQLCGTNFCTSSERFALSFVRNLTFPNAPKSYKTHQNMSLGSNGLDRVRSLRKIPKRLHGTNCALIAPVQPVLDRVSCSNETLPNTTKHYKTHTNMSLGSNGGGLDAFVAKHPGVTSWHELLY